MNKIRQVGFTLVELMITVSIIALLLAIAAPAYVNYSRESSRSEGQAELLRVAGLQERFYLQNNTYTTVLADVGLVTDITEHGFYKIAIPVANATTFTITATAEAGTSQENDAGCTVLSLTSAGVKTPANCW